MIILNNVSGSYLEIKHTTPLLLCLLLGYINIQIIQCTFSWYVWQKKGEVCPLLPGDLVMQLILPALLLLRITSSLLHFLGQRCLRCLSPDPNLCLPPKWSSMDQLPALFQIRGEEHYSSWICFAVTSDPWDQDRLYILCLIIPFKYRGFNWNPLSPILVFMYFGYERRVIWVTWMPHKPASCNREAP